jgi:hypothetical protein
MVEGTWARGHARRGENGARRVRPIPGPDAIPDEMMEDAGELIPDEPAESPFLDGPAEPAGDLPPIGAGSFPGDDPAAAHSRRDWKRAPGKKPAARPGRITAGIRGDIDAKIRFALQVPGTIWQARDPLCGGTFIEQIPETAEAFTDIVCDSADLVAFFTGPGGNFMKLLKLGAALMPVVQVTMAHHVYHSIELAEAEPQADVNYAA